MRIPLAIVLALASFAFVLPLTGSAQEPSDIQITTDKTTYIDGYGADRFVHVSITGLDSCAGEMVKVGLFGENGGLAPGGPSVRDDLTVPADGNLTTQVPILAEQAGTVAHVGVRGNCVPGMMVLGEPLTFLHSDPAFGPTFPPEPLPDGVTITTDKQAYGDADEVIGVTVSGFPACFGRTLAVHLSTDLAEPIFADPNRGVSATGTFAGDGTLNVALPLDDVPVGRYAVWIRSVCTGTWMSSELLLRVGTTPDAATPATPRPPVVGTGLESGTGSFAPSLPLVAIILVAGATAAIALRSTSRRPKTED